MEEAARAAMLEVVVGMEGLRVAQAVGQEAAMAEGRGRALARRYSTRQRENCDPQRSSRGFEVVQ